MKHLLIQRSPHRANRLKVRLLPKLHRVSPPFARTVYRVIQDQPDTVERFKRFGLEPKDILEVPVDHLLHQRPVRCEVIPSREATTLDFLDQYFTNASGRSERQISQSMQYRLLDAYSRGELPDDLSETDYWQWHVRLREAGINERPDEMIARKVRGLITIYESIRERGYQYGDLASYVWVLDKPLIATRYGYQYRPEGLEIFDGHHRAAAVACLGYASIHVLLLTDVGTRTAFGVPLADVVQMPGEVPVR